LSDLSIVNIIKKKAEKNPERIALVAQNRTPLTYRSLYNQIEDIVTKLNSLGVGHNDRVAIALPNGPEMAVAFLSVAAAATCAPLNPAYSAKEFEFYLSSLKAKALIVQSGIDSPARAVAQDQGIAIFELSPVWEAAAGIFNLTGNMSSPNPAQSGFAKPDDVALVLHTSGTTSRPKIVPLSHINLCTSAKNIRVALNLVEGDRCLNVLPLFHIYGLIGSILSSLSAGGSVVCTSGFDASSFFSGLLAFQPTWYAAVPTMHQEVLTHTPANRDKISQHPLRLICSGAAAVPQQVIHQLEATFQAPVIEQYGMTEASLIASNPLPPGERKPGSVGLAAGTQIAIMDEMGNLLPTGEVGEVVIQGANVTQGYENNPEANAKAFTNGWFRTGDLGYLDENGYLFLKGRLKEIINRGGEKIYPIEVDEVLMELPGIVQAITFGVPHPTLGEDVAAAVVLKEGTQLEEQTIRRFLFERLADFKVPSQVAIVDAIPKGATGKVQRLGLAEKLAGYLKREYIPPRNEIEHEIADIFAQVLMLERVGVHDNFFGLGGHSLLAAQIISCLRQAFCIELHLQNLFQLPTVAELAKYIETVGLIQIEEGEL
jgi:acyl-CoA synthetase (AMP-forming)/AMP-acid ligase II/acyl carrier protein